MNPSIQARVPAVGAGTGRARLRWSRGETRDADARSVRGESDAGPVSRASVNSDNMLDQQISSPPGFERRGPQQGVSRSLIEDAPAVLPAVRVLLACVGGCARND